MIPYIIGGVALAATGYGLRKYLEEEAIVESKIPRVDLSEFLANLGKENSTVLDEYKNIKTYLEKTTLKEMQDAFREIKNLELTQFKASQEDKNSKNEKLLLDDSNIPIIKEFINILSNAKTMQNILLDEQEDIIVNCDDYYKYSQEQKMKVQEALSIYVATKSIVNLALTYDEISISKTTLRAFAKLKKLVEAEII